MTDKQTLSKDLFVEQMNILLVAFPSWNFDANNPLSLKVWYDKFKNFDEERFIHMIDSYVNDAEFNPTIAGLKKHDTLPRKSITQINHEKMLKENGLI